MGLCCSRDPVSDDALAFTSEDNKMVSEKKPAYTTLLKAGAQLQDNAPLLNTTDMKIVAATDSSDTMLDVDEINNFIAEQIENLSE